AAAMGFAAGVVCKANLQHLLIPMPVSRWFKSNVDPLLKSHPVTGFPRPGGARRGGGGGGAGIGDDGNPQLHGVAENLIPTFFGGPPPIAAANVNPPTPPPSEEDIETLIGLGVTR